MTLYLYVSFMKELKEKPHLENNKVLALFRLIGRRKYLIFFTSILILLLTFGSLFALYWVRPPVLIVSDSSFAMLYGPDRLSKAESRISRRFLRRIIQVIVDENAGPDLIAIAVERASQAPIAVLFPHRYIDGARQYMGAYPEIPVWVVTTMSSRSQEDEEFSFIGIDVALDLYRAGLCAALLADGKKVAFISEMSLSDEYREVFQEGLRAQGHLDDPTWGSFYTNYSSDDDLGCVILTGPATDFLEKNLDVPIILFSWVDPVFTPRAVKVFFDDSMWAMLPKILKSFPLVQGDHFFSSEPVVLKDRIENANNFRQLRDLVKENL